MSATADEHGGEPQAIGDYRVLRPRPLGEGAAGKVYLVTPTASKEFALPGELLAIKVYKPEILSRPRQVDRIRQEFKAGHSISSPYLVRTYEFIEGEPSYLVMDFVDGIPLPQWIQQFHPVSAAVAFRFVDHLVSALESIHEADGIHRDVKPANVIVSDQFVAKLMDLGVLRFDDSESLTDSDDFVGTKRNAAPEFLEGRDDYDQRIDLYSLGTVIYALLHGREVFDTESNSAALTQLVLNEDPAFDDSIRSRDPISRCLFELCRELLSKSPEDRPASIVDVRARLDALRESDELRAGAEPLYAYVGTALTNLDPGEREAIVFVSKQIADAAKGFEIYVYQPRRATDPLLHPDVEANVVHMLDRGKVEHADVVFFLLNETSFGVGQEIEIASAAGKPIILIHRDGINVSRMVTGTLGNVLDRISYDGPEDLQSKLRESMGRHMGTLRRAHEFANAPGFPIGEHLRNARIAKGHLSAESFAREIGLSPRLVEVVEAGDFNNVPFDLVTRWAHVLGVTLVELLGDDIVAAVRDDLFQDDNLRELKIAATAGHWDSADYVELEDEYRREFAASGRSRRLSRSEWLDRYSALQRQRIGTEPTQLPLEEA